MKTVQITPPVLYDLMNIPTTIRELLLYGAEQTKLVHGNSDISPAALTLNPYVIELLEAGYSLDDDISHCDFRVVVKKTP